MDFGIAMFVTDETVAPAELGRMVEERGFESLFVPDHTHIPVSRRTPYPAGTLPEYYKRMLDPFVALASASAATTTLLLGTGVCLVAERVLAMKEIWTKDEAEFHGDLVDFDPIWSWPKPQTTPHPPILMGGAGPKAIERVLDYCDGWLAGMQPPDAFIGRCAELQRRAADAGRAPIPVTVTASFEPAAIETLRRAGVGRTLAYVEGTERETEAELDRLAALAELSR